MSNPLGALLGLATNLGIAGFQAHSKAKRLNQYDDQLNAQLQQQGVAPVNFQRKKFYFGTGDAERNKGLAEQALKGYQDQQYLGDQQNWANSHGINQQFGSSTGAKEALSPYISQDAQYQVPGQYGRAAVQGERYIQGLTQQPDPGASQGGYNPNPQKMIFPSAGGPLQWDPGEQTPMAGLSAGATQQAPIPDVPDGAYITPGMLKDGLNRQITQQNADTGRMAAETGQNRLGFDQAKYANEAPLRSAKIQEIQARLKTAGINNKWLERLLVARIGAANRSGHPAGRGPNASEQLDADIQEGIRQGYVSPEEAGAIHRIKFGLQPRASNASQGSTSTTYDAAGNVKSTTTRSRTGTGQSARPGNRKDYGYGAVSF